MEREEELFEDKDIILTNKHVGVLITLNFLLPNMEIHFREVNGYKLRDMCMIDNLKQDEKGNWWVSATSYETDVKYNLPIKYIERIQGMTIYKFLLSCNINEEGIVTRLFIEEPTDIETDVIGKKHWNYNGIELYNGMIIEFIEDKSDDWRCQILTVNGVGTDEGIYFKFYKGRKRTHINGDRL